MSKQDTEAFLFFLEKLLTHESPEAYTYIDQLSILLKDYTDIALQYYSNSSDIIKKT